MIEEVAKVLAKTFIVILREQVIRISEAKICL
jgi:hypothetical protein